MWRQLLAVAAFALGASGCTRAEPATAAALRARASFELGCEALSLVRIDQSTGGVAGCGRRVVYLERCDREVCRWVFEREVPPPPAWSYPPALASQAQRQPTMSTTTTLLRAPPANDEWRTRVPTLSAEEPGF